MNGSQFPQLNDVAWLTEHYVAQQLNAIEVAKIVGCERSSVIRALKRHGIEVRSYGNRRSKYPQLADRDWLKAQFEAKPLLQIAEELNVSVGAVGYFARKHGLVRSQARADAIRAGIAKRFPNGRRGADTGNWRGGRQLINGYVFLHAPDHPRAKNGRIQEHILVAEKTIGRHLEPDEIVHHVNHVKDDNRPENLIVKKKGDHIREHFDAGRGYDALKAENARLRQLLIDNGIDPED